MTMLTTQHVRSAFINYFVQNDHTHVPSSPLIPHNDPSLMFVNSGMVQFKNVFTGLESRGYKCAVTSQKSMRAGGKHNDLENVGYTARHHTFFEMLGNFSFGDYFKEQAIYHAWNLLTKDFCIPKDKLYATVYYTDDDAFNYWKKIAGLDDSRIIRIRTNDNFWSMGDTGPCGPCSEIFFDHGESVPGGLPGTPDEGGDRYTEIWNLVFMQFEQIDKDTRIELPKKSVDTGMGLERVAAVLQGVHDNYDIDLFTEIINTAESIIKVKAKADARFSYRIIADHLRASAFLIADGIMPSNEGRGYVLRRIMRRSMRHVHQLGYKQPLMHQLLPKLIELMGSVYPELQRAGDFISSILEQEENRFKNTLDNGLKLLDKETADLAQGSILNGEVAFKLYDTYGFPVDLTEDILKKQQISVDMAAFDLEMQKQKDRARKAWVGSGEASFGDIWFDIKAKYGNTEFLGYSLDSLSAKVLALVQDNKLVHSISKHGETFTVITNQTPFYGESGGQMGDIGIIVSQNSKIAVINTVKYLGSLHAHICVLEDGVIVVDDTVTLNIDVEYRKNLRAHHSATHILHAVLRGKLGKHITQKGSLVACDRLRFDISHPKAITKEELELIEDTVNHIIIDNSQINTHLMSTNEAIENGAMALFGEKYDSEVRVVSMGHFIEDGKTYSIELCGGTHAARTGDIGAFKILSESGISAGVRRIEAVCGASALKFCRQNQNLLEEISDILKSTKAEIINKVGSLLLGKKTLEKELEKLKIGGLDLKPDEILAQSVPVSDGRLVYKLVQDIDPKLLRSAAVSVSNKVDNVIVIYICSANEKISITVAVNKCISKKYAANNIAKEISVFLGGNGGNGTELLAQAGGSDAAKLSLLYEYLCKELSINRS